jgi:hypothetical protein
LISYRTVTTHLNLIYTKLGVTALPGLYFLGLPWLYKRKSSLLYGVGEDAAFIASAIADRE